MKNTYHFLIHHDNKQKAGVQAPSKTFEKDTEAANDAAAIELAKTLPNVERVQSDKTGKFIYDISEKNEADQFAFSLEKKAPTLKPSGPTIAAYVKAGYDPKNYPPDGYAAVSTKAEIDAAIAAYGK